MAEERITMLARRGYTEWHAVVTDKSIRAGLATVTNASACSWEDLGDTDRDAWRAAVRKVLFLLDLENE